TGDEPAVDQQREFGVAGGHGLVHRELLRKVEHERRNQARADAAGSWRRGRREAAAPRAPDGGGRARADA
ncbi:MAG: hypothetical protein ACK559_22405, partial [bacterium]